MQEKWQDDGDEQIIFVILAEQPDENVDEAQKSHNGSKLRCSLNVERGRKVGHFWTFCDYFAL